MRRPSNRLAPEALTVRRKGAWTVDSAGGRIPAAEVAEALPGSMQAARAMSVPDHLRDAAAIDSACYFLSDPRLRRDDLVENARGDVMVVAAPAIDESGRGVWWVVYGARKA